MFAYLFLVALLATVAAEPAHLKPGALAAHLGRVSLVVDVVWVRYPYASLVGVPGALRSVLGQVDAALRSLEEDLPTGTSYAAKLLALYRVRLHYINDTVAPD